MTVEELIKVLQEFDSDAEVVMWGNSGGDADTAPPVVSYLVESRFTPDGMEAPGIVVLE